MATTDREIDVTKPAQGGAIAVLPTILLRNQAEARRIANDAYPFHCCVVCGLQVATCLQIAHLDHNAANNVPSNLARLCPTHHWMYDSWVSIRLRLSGCFRITGR